MRDVNCADGDDIEIYDGQESMEIEVKISNGHENIAIINGGDVLPCFAVRHMSNLCSGLTLHLCGVCLTCRQKSIKTFEPQKSTKKVSKKTLLKKYSNQNK